MGIIWLGTKLCRLRASLKLMDTLSLWIAMRGFYNLREDAVYSLDWREPVNRTQEQPLYCCCGGHHAWQPIYWPAPLKHVMDTCGAKYKKSSIHWQRCALACRRVEAVLDRLH